MKLIEQFLYYSVGFAAQTGERLTKLVQKLIEQGQISKAEGKEFLDEYAEKANEMTKKFDEKLENFIGKTLENTKFAKNEDLQKIEERIKKIEDNFK
ncbi:MAG: hypothetical protein JXL97_15180 [Bacteroidales bacterium]|nr:hypothetical protein [Bacteroidales bacterium]